MRTARVAVFDAGFVRRWIRETAVELSAQRDYLTQLDAAIGDADHGINMDRGFVAAVSALEAADDASPGDLLVQAGTTLMFRVGGAAGPLYGTGLREAGRALGGAPAFGMQELISALRSALDGIQSLGAAVEGDKTIVDAWAPAVGVMEHSARSGATTEEVLRAGREAAEEGASATTPLQARKGRASYLGPRSVGHQDPGATSTALMFAALERAGRAS
ncbi:MAG TPA: dihydroxyacetone kinase subunit DhaL [Actinomycetota bacterium]|nr:dihydroxyacetone kinase subunit DhaL [Actinomycetota bacterium]